MLRNAARIFIAIALIIGAAQAALAGKRVALVIGNGAYMNAPPLTNPRHDAEDMAAALRALGFTVILGIDLDKRAMDRKILEFESALSGTDAGVFHYSGHGLQVAGVNYLVPVDASLESAAALRIEAVRLDLVQETMERESKTNILFLDACRNNPLSRNLARSLGTRSSDIGQGLAASEAGLGTLIAFSTQPGNVALDGAGRNSPFSGPLAKAILTPGKDLFSILIEVRKEVLAVTGGKQVTWDHSALSAPFYFQPDASQFASEKGQPPDEAAQAWVAIQSTSSEAVLEEFIRRFPGSAYAGFARARLEEVRKQNAALLRPLQPRETETRYYFVWDTRPPDDWLDMWEYPNGRGRHIRRMPNGTPLELIQKGPGKWHQFRNVQTGETGWAAWGNGSGDRIWVYCCRTLDALPRNPAPYGD